MKLLLLYENIDSDERAEFRFGDDYLYLLLAQQLLKLKDPAVPPAEKEAAAVEAAYLKNRLRIKK